MKTYVLVGTGGRSTMFTEALSHEYKDSSRLAAVCDVNEGRLDYCARKVRQFIPDLATYGAEDFDRMLAEQRPDCVIVTTLDREHSEYICRSLKAGCDVITEKPMTIDEHKCQRIVDTIAQTGKSVRVTFNYRYSPPRSQLKEILMTGVIGKILSVSFQWNLDTNHGADYFRRWHRHKGNSGGLMVHKATHHFDIVNWWLGAVPETVFAEGRRGFYNAEQARRYGLENHGARCLECPVQKKCNFYLDMRKVRTIKELYLNNEQHDGYYRDRCVFADEIDIEDSMNVVVRYRDGAILSYCLNAFLPWEGYRIEFNGTKGRLEHNCQETSYINGDGTVQGGLKSEGTNIKVYPHFKTPYSIPVWSAEGSHGGGDTVMLNDIFGRAQPDPLRRAADYVQGAYSILVGVAANNSMASGRKIAIRDLVSGLGNPHYPTNGGADEPIPFVPAARCLSAEGIEIQANAPQPVGVSADANA